MTFFIISVVSIAIVAVLLLLVLFEPGLKYRVEPPEAPLDSDRFLCVLGALADAQVHHDSRVEVHTNGPDFYEAQLAAIRAARSSIHLEAFIFHPGPIGDRFVAALAERAKAGVRVKVVVDAIGSLPTPNRFFRPLRDAGGRVEWYQPIRWYLLKRLNNRTHRELMVIDGEVGFIGGAGIASHWIDGDPPRHGKPARPFWRDTVCRVTGDLVTGLQTTFAENWLESSSEILSHDGCFPLCQTGGGSPNPSPEGGSPNPSHGPEDSIDPRSSAAAADRAGGGRTSGLVVISTPSAARSTRARVVFQILLASARRSIHINSPYFVPDRSVQDELVKAAGRGVDVKVITPGELNNHPMTRRSSRRRLGPLLKAGVRVFEYQPAMIHRKILIVDGVWAVVGSTNFDNRSFGLNDEVNMAAAGPALADRLEQDFQADLAESRELTFEQWLRRPLSERVLAALGRAFERQE